ncbi:hypothetical protein [Longitalea arenae]|uniref:hypothetical protein n=1 Tax=Longitalea arenae TaxID=2812558 RepID=UPI0019682FC4|nr:hypothetical protein [Longitalea arenae]
MPDGNPYNNWSYPGNTNPYTGKVAGGDPDTYLSNYYNRSSSSTSPTTYPNSYYSYPSTTYSYYGYGSTYSSSIDYEISAITSNHATKSIPIYTPTYTPNHSYAQSNSVPTKTFSSNSANVISTKTVSPDVKYYQVVNARAYFYEYDTVSSIKNAYLVLGEKFKVVANSNGFCYTIYTNSTGKTTRGWINEKDITPVYSELSSTEVYFRVVSEKAFFYSSPNGQNKRQAYLILGQRIKQITQSGSFLYTVFVNSRGQETAGWIQLADLVKE